ncbi:hypothetical protein OPV22_033208 [Ensete ventricosum]|uniref:Uncharacterized protein n=1 Tax=Ensete ventricosum TaxID=4639 RepID=A0AAV8PXK6_ENSVE|nr:hypothetical protein OPV22_033208 [Ensete ventricosum]
MDGVINRSDILVTPAACNTRRNPVPTSGAVVVAPFRSETCPLRQPRDATGISVPCYGGKKLESLIKESWDLGDKSNALTCRDWLVGL